jgi:superfamily II RNA helicase
MIKTDVDSEIAILHSTIEKLNDEINKLHDVLQHNKTPQETVELYIDLLEKRKTAVNKKRKEIDREIGHLTQHFKTIESDKKLYEAYADKCNAFKNTGKLCNELQHCFETQTNNILKLLCEEEFVETNDNLYSLTVKGMFATHIRELPSLTFANIIANDTFNELSSKQLISIFSCFTNIKVSDELQAIIPKSDDTQVLHVIELIKTKNDYYVDKELELQINTGVDYTMHFDLIDYVSEWCDCVCIEDCKFFLQKIESEKGIFLGEFTKALLKINNISLEIEKIAELLGNLPLLSKLKEIPLLTLKYVVTNQSLYV